MSNQDEFETNYKSRQEEWDTPGSPSWLASMVNQLGSPGRVKETVPRGKRTKLRI